MEPWGGNSWIMLKTLDKERSESIRVGKDMKNVFHQQSIDPHEIKKNHKDSGT